MNSELYMSHVILLVLLCGSTSVLATSPETEDDWNTLLSARWDESTKTMNLSNQNLTRIPPDVFASYNDIQVLDLSSNTLKDLCLHVFDNLKQSLKHLNLRNNQLHMKHFNGELKSFFNFKTKGNSPFSFMKNLETLNLDGNNIQYPRGQWFDGCKTLHTLTLSRNQIQVLRYNPFETRRVPALKTLDLSNNPISKVNGDAMRESKNLENLTLSRDLISELPTGFFSENKQLKNLVIIGNSNEASKLQDLGLPEKCKVVIKASNMIKPTKPISIISTKNNQTAIGNNGTSISTGTVLGGIISTSKDKKDKKNNDWTYYVFVPLGTLSIAGALFIFCYLRRTRDPKLPETIEEEKIEIVQENDST